MLADVCGNQYMANVIFSGGMSGAGNTDFKIKGGATNKAKKRSLSPRETSVSVTNQEVQKSTLHKRMHLGYDPNHPCDATFEANFPKPNPALGYVAVYSDRIIFNAGKSQQTFRIDRTRATITSTYRPDATTRSNAIRSKLCRGDRYPQVGKSIRTFPFR